MVRSAAGADPFESKDYGIGFLLRVAHRLASTTFSGALSGEGIEPRHFGVLAVLVHHQPLSQSRLVDLLSADKSAMVRTVDELEDRGLVVRRPDPQDRRAHAVSLTGAGELAHVRAEQAAILATDKIFSHFTPAERSGLHLLLRKLIDPAAD